jgi:V8-like Glu-specific endopeptidase
MARLFTFTLLFLASTAVTAVPARALIFGEDHRVGAPTDPKSLFGPVGIIYGMPEASYATAFLVDDCHALTVRHAFGDHASIIGREATFAANVRDDRKRWRKTGAVVVAEGGVSHRETPSVIFGERQSDWAILRLDKCLGRKFGHAELSSRAPSDSEIIGMAGFPVDRPLSDGIVVDPACRVREVQARILLHDCAMQPGNSGSPLYRVSWSGGHPHLEVFGMNVAGSSFGVPGANLKRPVRSYLRSYANVAISVAVAQGSLSGMSWRQRVTGLTLRSGRPLFGRA